MLRPGDKFDRYVLDAVLGEGGMGVVYRAHDTRLDRRVALKIVRPEPNGDDARRKLATDRLMREARAAAALHHPNAVSIFDVGEIEDTAFIAMELVQGRTLRAVIGDASVPWRDRVRMLCDVGRALEAAHRAGLVHRDVKPENVMVGDDGSIKVLDFGIARRAAGDVDPSAPTQAPSISTLTAEGVRVGTPTYMAPEQIRGDDVDGRTDQFAWGVLAYELLTGKPPWRSASDDLGVVAAILTETPAPLRDVAPSVPRDVEAVILRALAKSPADRFGSIAEAVRALEATLYRSIPPPGSAEADRAPRSGDFRRYSESEVDEILDRALAEDEGGARMGHATLMAAAREIGVPDERIQRAVREVEEARALEQEDEGWRKRQFSRLVRHLASFVAVNVFLIVTIGWRFDKWVFFGWGIGVVMNVVSYFFPDHDRERKREERRRSRKDRKRGRREARERTRVATPRIDEGVELLRKTAERRVRVATPEPRVRVAEESSHETEREDEQRRRMRR